MREHFKRFKEFIEQESWFYKEEPFKNAAKSIMVMGTPAALLLPFEFLATKVAVRVDRGESYRDVFKSLIKKNSKPFNGLRYHALYTSIRIISYRANLLGYLTIGLQHHLPQSLTTNHPNIVPGISAMLMSGGDAIIYPIQTATARLQANRPLQGLTITDYYKGVGYGFMRGSIVWGGFFTAMKMVEKAKRDLAWQPTVPAEIVTKAATSAVVISVAARGFDRHVNLKQTANKSDSHSSKNRFSFSDMKAALDAIEPQKKLKATLKAISSPTEIFNFTNMKAALNIIEPQRILKTVGDTVVSCSRALPAATIAMFFLTMSSSATNVAKQRRTTGLRPLSQSDDLEPIAASSNHTLPPYSNSKKWQNFIIQQEKAKVAVKERGG